MSTNFYLRQPACEACGHQPDQLHIGLSAGGWYFALHVDEDIKCLMDWVRLWKAHPDWAIEDEYGGGYTRNEMLRKITMRHQRPGRRPTQEWFDRNHAMTGPGNLARSVIPRQCIGHGKGTWDLIEGEFS